VTNADGQVIGLSKGEAEGRSTGRGNISAGHATLRQSCHIVAPAVLMLANLATYLAAYELMTKFNYGAAQSMMLRGCRASSPLRV